MDVSDVRQGSGARPSRPARCLAPGCPCQDARIVSHRRARFFAHLAVVTGETADRIIEPEADWSLPIPLEPVSMEPESPEPEAIEPDAAES